MAVMILTRSFDPTSDWVIEELNRRRVPVFRCDIAGFPMELAFSAVLRDRWTGTLGSGQRSIDFDDITGIYYRRPTSFQFPDGMSAADKEWASIEAKLGFLGTLSALPRWLNHPSRIAHAEYKPIQLHVARQQGLKVPQTLITNNPNEAHEFAQDIGDVIYKPLSPRGVRGDDGRRRLIFTQRISPEDCCDPDLALTAHMVQEWVPHTHAVRVTIVDGQFFAAEIHSDSERARVDWRSDYDSLTYTPVTVPDEIQSRVQEFMREFELRFAALDFLVTERGDWLFLEVNPNGQWAWIGSIAPGIASALADALTKGP